MFEFLKITFWTFVHKFMLLFSVYLIINLKVPDDNVFYYTLGESLGKGSFGKVVSCTKNNNTFAMKIQKKEDNEFYEEEVRVLETIHGNKNCVEMISTFENDTLHFIVFEKLYKSVFEMILEKSPLDIPCITKQVLEALEFLESENIIHGDIKPENIMFVNKGEPHVKLIDFGLSTFDYSTEKTNTISTTPYRCPESLFNLIWSFGTDIWALACVMCEMKTGELFFNTADHCEEYPNDDFKQTHLSMIEKTCGRFTKQMVRKCSKFFNEDGLCGSSFMSEESKEFLKSQKQVREVFFDNEDAADLVTKMLVIDPHRRMNASRALIHKFFN